MPKTTWSNYKRSGIWVDPPLFFSKFPLCPVFLFVADVPYWRCPILYAACCIFKRLVFKNIKYGMSSKIPPQKNSTKNTHVSTWQKVKSFFWLLNFHYQIYFILFPGCCERWASKQPLRVSWRRKMLKLWGSEGLWGRKKGDVPPWRDFLSIFEHIT